jgi:catechol 2,3-dioxygenase-like lactoylglutathione lyase family enzyme
MATVSEPIANAISFCMATVFHGDEKRGYVRCDVSLVWPTPCKAVHVQARHEPVESISAVTLLVVEMAETVTFYQALGFYLLYGGIEAAFTSFRVGAGYLNLQLDTDGSPERAIWGRVVFWVDNVDAMHERCVAAGFRPDTSPADAPWGERYFHIRDPSGHELSFARPLAR